MFHLPNFCTMVLLHVGEALEDYTQRRAESGLISFLLTLPETVRVVREDLASLVALRKLSIGLEKRMQHRYFCGKCSALFA